MRASDYVVESAKIPGIAQKLIELCCIEGVRNAGGRWQRCEDEARLQKRVETLLRQVLTDTDSPNTPADSG